MTDKWKGFEESGKKDKWADYEEPAPAREKMGMGQSALRGFNQAITLGLWDEAEAGLRALPSVLDKDKKFSEEYRRIRDQERAANAQALEDRPLVYGTGSAFGTVPGAGYVAKTAAAMPSAISAGTNAAVNAGIIGAVQGAGNAEEMSDVPREATRGAALNALLAGAFGTGAPVATQLTKNAANKALGGPNAVSRFKENYSRLQPKVTGKIGPATAGFGAGTGAGAYNYFGPGLVGPESTAPETLESDPGSVLMEKGLKSLLWGLGGALGATGLSKMARAGGAFQATRRGEGGAPATPPSPPQGPGPTPGGGMPPLRTREQGRIKGNRPNRPLNLDSLNDNPVTPSEFEMLQKYFGGQKPAAAANPVAEQIKQVSKQNPAAGRQVAMQAQATAKGRAATNMDSPVRDMPEGVMGMQGQPYQAPGTASVQQSEDELFKAMSRPSFDEIENLVRTDLTSKGMHSVFARDKNKFLNQHGWTEDEFNRVMTTREVRRLEDIKRQIENGTLTKYDYLDMNNPKFKEITLKQLADQIKRVQEY